MVKTTIILAINVQADQFSLGAHVTLLASSRDYSYLLIQTEEILRNIALELDLMSSKIIIGVSRI